MAPSPTPLHPVSLSPDAPLARPGQEGVPFEQVADGPSVDVHHGETAEESEAVSDDVGHALPVPARSLAPAWGLVAAAVMLVAMGVAMESLGLLIAGALAATLFGRARRGEAPMADGARGIATAAPFALVGPLVWTAVPVLDAGLCTDPGPALFVLLWPASVAALAVGAVVVARTARREAWPLSTAPEAALWGLSALCAALHLGVAASWTCDAGAGSVLAAGFAAAWAVVAFAASRRLGEKGTV